MAAHWKGGLIGLVILAIGLVAVLLAAPAIHHRLVFGTFSTQGPPPRIDYCGRRYYPNPSFPNAPLVSGSEVRAFLAANGQTGLKRIGTAPSGMPIVAHIIDPADRGFDKNLCTMTVWVQVSGDRYLGYALSGGP